MSLLLIGFGGVLVPVILTRPFVGLLAMMLAETTRRFVAIPGVGEVSTLLGIITLVGVLLEGQRVPGVFRAATRSGIWRMILLFAGWGLIAVPTSYDVAASLGGWLRMITRFVPFFFVVASQVRTERRMRAFTQVAAVTAAYWALESLSRYLFLTRGRSELSFATGRGAAELLGSLGIPAVLAILWHERSRIRRWALWGILCSFSFAVVISGARAGVLSLLILSVFIVARKYGPDMRAWVSLGALGALFFFLTPKDIAETRYNTLVSQGAEARPVGLRLNMWYAGVALVRDHPVFGVGLGNSAIALPEYASEFQIAGLAAKGSARYVHSAYLDVAVQMGIPGMVIYIALLATTFMTLNESRRQARAAQSSPLEILSLVFMAGLVADSVQGMFGKSWDSTGLWYILGLAPSLWDQSRRALLSVRAASGRRPKGRTPRLRRIGSVLPR